MALVTLSLAWDDIKPLLEKADLIGVDTETNFKKGESRRDCRDGTGHAIGISLSCRVAEIFYCTYLPFRHESESSFEYDVGQNLDRSILTEVQEFFVNYTGKIVMHNAKFDLVSLSTLGINYTGYFYCSLEMCHLTNENLPYSKDLTSCARKYVDNEESKKDDAEFISMCNLFGYAGVPIEKMRPYAEHDAALCLAVAYSIMELFYLNVTEKYWLHKQQFTRVVIAMESLGVRVDVDLCKKMTAIGDTNMADLLDTVGINLGSTKQLGELLIDKLGYPVVKTTPAGKPSFDKFAMEEYEHLLARDLSETGRQILAYRGWQKSVSSNYVPYVELLSLDGRLRPNYKLHGTKTGRMSCEKPNLQQIPKVTDKPWNGRMKACFIPEDGYELWEADYSQLELRLGAAYAKESSLIQVFAEGRDIFTEMSKRIGLNRFDTKTFVYSTQYGAGIERIHRALGVTREKAQEIRQDYKDAYPGFVQITNLAATTCIAKKRVQLWSGRYRHFQYPKDESHKAFNSVIQGGAADIVEHVMVRLFNELHGPECRMLLQVHDSVVFEIRTDLVEFYRSRITDIMSDVRPDFGVLFAVDFHPWGK